MEYERKYKAALKWMQSLYSGLHGATKEEAEKYFPELKESEDEKMRKSLINFLKSPFVNENITDEKVAPWIAWLEKQGENEPTDKVEPKFKVGDWIVTDDSFGKIVRHVDEISSNIIDERYVVSDEYGLTYNISFDKEHKWHKWTIQDAMDGDVLATENFIFIFKNIDDGNGVHYYCQYEIIKHENDNQFDIALPQSLMGRVSNSISHYSPATKEQRDQLFQKMKEAGYEWDSEKKELKNIEVASKESEDESIRLEIRNFIWGYPDKLPERDKWLAWFEKQADKDKLIRDLGEYKVKYTQKVLQEDLNKIESQSQPNFNVGDKVTIEGDDTIYTICRIDLESCWLTHEGRGRGWAKLDSLKHYVE